MYYTFHHTVYLEPRDHLLYKHNICYIYNMSVGYCCRLKYNLYTRDNIIIVAVDVFLATRFITVRPAPDPGTDQA